MQHPQGTHNRLCTYAKVHASFPCATVIKNNRHNYYKKKEIDENGDMQNGGFIENIVGKNYIYEIVIAMSQ